MHPRLKKPDKTPITLESGNHELIIFSLTLIVLTTMYTEFIKKAPIKEKRTVEVTVRL